MDTINVSEKTVVMKSSQVGGTEILLNAIGYSMHQDPSPIMLLEPTIEMSETISKDRIAPMLRDTPVLNGLVGKRRSKDSDNRILHKVFPGGHLTLAGANSSASLASRPIRNLFIDECDRFPFSAGKEGDPIKLATKRTSTFWNRRIAIVSTPTIKGASRIEYEYELSDKRRYFVPCPHCCESQILSWSQVKYSQKLKEIEEAWYECQHCQGKITDSHKGMMLAAGQWRPTAKATTPGFHLNELYSPWKRFAEVCQDFIDSKDDRELLKVWVNTALGESFDEQGGEGLAWQTLMGRAEPYAPLSVPMGGLLLTAGVDVQGDRLAVSVWAWGRGEESWLIYQIELYGDPTESAVWEQLDTVLDAKYTHESGTELAIAAAAIDTGYKPQSVYNFCRKRPGRHLIPVKGMSTPGKPILGKPTYQEVTYRGQALKKGIRLFPVGTDVIKGIIYSRLRLLTRGAGYIHFPMGMDSEYFEQLTAEKVVTRYLKGFPKREWVKTRPRNEALDCAVYAYAAAVYAGLVRVDWAKLEASLIDVPELEPEPEVEKKAWVGRRAKSGFTKGW